MIIFIFLHSNNNFLIIMMIMDELVRIFATQNFDGNSLVLKHNYSSINKVGKKMF
jgi:hypothetical protein